MRRKGARWLSGMKIGCAGRRAEHGLTLRLWLQNTADSTEYHGFNNLNILIYTATSP